MSWAALAERYGTTRESVRNAVRRWRQEKGEVPEFPDLRLPPGDSWGTDLLDALIEYQQRLDELDTGQDEATVAVNTDRPFGIVFTGDWHMGSRSTDHRLMREDFELIRQTDGLYACPMGDYGDFFLRDGTPRAQDAQLPDAEVQAELAQRPLARYFEGKLVAVILGNHDWWLRRAAGNNLCMRVAQQQAVPFLRHGGSVTLRTPGAEYRLAVRHDFPGRSRINTTNNQRRLFEAVGGADVVVLAHLHFADLQQQSRGRHERTIWLRSGTYKTLYDDHAARYGFPSGDPSMPMVVFWPDRKHMVPFASFRDGIDYLRFLREHRFAS